MDTRFETAAERLQAAQQDGNVLLCQLPIWPTAEPWDFYDAGDGAFLYM